MRGIQYGRSTKYLCRNGWGLWRDENNDSSSFTVEKITLLTVWGMDSERKKLVAQLGREENGLKTVARMRKESRLRAVREMEIKICDGSNVGIEKSAARLQTGFFCLQRYVNSNAIC